MTEDITGIWYDEASNISLRQYRFVLRWSRKRKAKLGWPNWCIDRKRLPLMHTKKELRALSWRRVI